LSNKSKAAGVGIVLVIGGLAALGLRHIFDLGGGLGLGVMGTTSSNTSKGNSNSQTGALVITVQGEQYIVDGSPSSFDDVVSAAIERSKSQSDQTGAQVVLRKKGSARYMTVLKLEEEFQRRGIRYKTENDF
jgi:hypothetical protein